MATVLPTTEIPLTLRVSDRARTKLAQQAASSGKDISAVASDLIEHAVAQPSVDEALAPFRKQVAESGMSDERPRAACFGSWPRTWRSSRRSNSPT